MQKKMFLSLLVCLFVFTGTRLLAQCGTTNIALNKTVLTSSNGSGTSGSGITDGLVTSVSTIWMPNYGSNNWAEIDLGNSKEVCKVKVKWGRWNAASAFKIQMSNSSGAGATWTDIATVTSNNPTVGNESGDYYTWFVFNELNITGTGNTGRYIRIRVDSLSNPNWWVSEMEVNEKTTINSPPGCNFLAPTASSINVVAGTPIVLSANASDPDPGGSISEVGFYKGTSSNSITELISNPPLTAAPYNYTWTPMTPGVVYIQIKAKDNYGAEGISNYITVNVQTNAGAWSLNGNDLTGVTDPFLGSPTGKNFPVIFKTSGVEKMRIATDGKVFIGTSGFPTSVPSDALLGVEGFIISKGLKVTQTNWPDYVFEKDYTLMPLLQLAEFIRKNKHLPGVPSMKQVSEMGVNVGENQEMLLRKIEELTLYILQQHGKIEELNNLTRQLQLKVEKLELKK